MNARVELELSDLTMFRPTPHAIGVRHQVYLGERFGDIVTFVTVADARKVADAWSAFADRLVEVEAWCWLAGVELDPEGRVTS